MDSGISIFANCLIVIWLTIEIFSTPANSFRSAIIFVLLTNFILLFVNIISFKVIKQKRSKFTAKEKIPTFGHFLSEIGKCPEKPKENDYGETSAGENIAKNIYEKVQSDKKPLNYEDVEKSELENEEKIYSDIVTKPQEKIYNEPSVVYESLAKPYGCEYDKPSLL